MEACFVLLGQRYVTSLAESHRTVPVHQRGSMRHSAREFAEVEQEERPWQATRSGRGLQSACVDQLPLADEFEAVPDADATSVLFVDAPAFLFRECLFPALVLLVPRMLLCRVLRVLLALSRVRKPTVLQEVGPTLLV